MLRLLMPTLVMLSLILSGCGLTLGPVAERETIWAKHGTSGKVVGKCETDVLVNDKRTRANIQGMIVIDEPTYELLLKTWKAHNTPERQ